MPRKTSSLGASLRGRKTPTPLLSTHGRKTPAPGLPTRDDLINAESRLGRTLFGPIPDGHRREFFHYQNNIWLWHESWEDQFGATQEFTIRYEVRPSGVFKKQVKPGAHYLKVQGQELENFRQAAHAYAALVKEKLY